MTLHELGASSRVLVVRSWPENGEMRDDFSQATKDLLAERVGIRCSNPGCRQPTSGPHEDPKRAVNVGVAGHITAAAAGGPRYDPTLTSQQRVAPENGIWLCAQCGRLVDADDVRFTVTSLNGWKRIAESMARGDLENRRDLTAEGSQTFVKAERLMPDLLLEMRADLTRDPLKRELVLLKRRGYWAKGNELVYYFDDHPELREKMQILANLQLVQEITYNDVARFVFTETIVDYLVATTPLNQGPQPAGTVAQGVRGPVGTMIGTITAETVHIGDTVTPTLAADSSVEIVFEPQRGDPYSTQPRLAGELSHVYRIGVRSNTTTAEPKVELVDARKIERSGAHAPIYGLAQLFGSLPCALAPTSTPPIHPGSSPTMFDLVKKSIGGDQKIWVCCADGADHGCLGMGRVYCLHFEVAAAGATDNAWFHVWARGRNLYCERVARGHEDGPHQVGLEDFSAAPILRWQSPTVRVEPVGADYRLALDVYCSNEGPRESNARIQDFEAELVGWGLLDFEGFERGTTVYSVHGTINNRFQLRIRQPSTSAYTLGRQTLTWSVIYSDDQNRFYLTRGRVIVDTPGVGPSRPIDTGLDESTPEERLARLIDAAPLKLRGRTVPPS